MEVRVATTVLERPALDYVASKRTLLPSRTRAAFEEAISKRRLTGKLSFGFYPVTRRELAAAVLAERLGDNHQSAVFLPYRGADAIVHAAQDMIR
jgi:hypothetical protein